MRRKELTERFKHTVSLEASARAIQSAETRVLKDPDAFFNIAGPSFEEQLAEGFALLSVGILSEY